MPANCALCIHPKRAEADQLLAAGGSLREVAGRFGTSKSAAGRHRFHVSAALAESADARDRLSADAILARLDRLERYAEELLAQLRRRKDLRGALWAVRELREQVEALGRLARDVQAAKAAAGGVDYGEILQKATQRAREGREEEHEARKALLLEVGNLFEDPDERIRELARRMMALPWPVSREPAPLERERPIGLPEPPSARPEPSRAEEAARVLEVEVMPMRPDPVEGAVRAALERWQRIHGR